MYKILKKSELLSGLSKLLSVMKKRIWIYVVTLIGSSAVFAICLNSLMALVLKDITDAALTRDSYLLKKTVIFASVLILITSVVAPTLIYICIRCIKQTMAEVRTKIYNHIMKLPMGYYENSHSGAIISNLTNDLNTMEYAYFFPLFNFLMSLIISISSIVIMFSLSKLIAGILIAIGIVAALINLRLSKPLKKMSHSIQELNSEATQRMIDLLSGFQVIKTYNIYKKIVGLYSDKSKELSNTMIKYSKGESTMISFNYCIKLLSFIGMVVLGAYLSIRNIENLGSTVACIRLQGGVTAMFVGMGGLVADLNRSIAGASRIFTLLGEANEEWGNINLSDYDKNIELYSNDKNAGVSSNNNKYAILMKDVVFSYDNNINIINSLNFYAEKGKITAIAGKSGEGKSTLIKLLLGFYKCKEGQIIINGRQAEAYSLEELRNTIAYVQQDSYLFSGTILENISYGNTSASKEEIIKCAREANAHEFIMNLSEGYDTVVEERGSNLSGGQRQRICIARAFLKNSPIILLDEAMSGLESKSEVDIFNALKARTNKQAIIIISHRPSTLSQCDVVHYISNGVGVGGI